MKTLQTLRLWAALLVAAGSTLQAQTFVRVTADNVNLRAKPQLENSEVLGQAHYGDQLAAREVGEEWIAVAAPAHVELWVNKSYVQQPQNTIGARRVNVRAGPSINHNIVETLELGTPVTPLEERQDWLRIAPQPSTQVWIHRDFVEILGVAAGTPAAIQAAAAPPPAAEPAEEPPPARKRKTREKAEASVEVAAAAPATAPGPALPTPIVSPSVPAKDATGREIPVPPPANLKLIPLEGQGRLAEFEGELRAAPLINEAPTRYRVVRWQSNRWQILCHVYGEAAKLRVLQDKRVRVKGREYWIQGAAAPVLVPDQIQEVAGE
jgi:SH3-like domain-containing protein